MPRDIKTDEQERLWFRAKQMAERQGQGGNWAYVRGIYNQMTKAAKSLEKSFYIPAAARMSRVPGQVPGRPEADNEAIRLAETRAPAMSEARLLAFDEPIHNTAGIVRGLGLGHTDERNWVSYLEGLLDQAPNEIILRRGVMDKCTESGLEPTARRAVMARSLTRYRSMSKSVIEVFSPDELLEKSKYTSRKRGKGGKWVYTYDTPTGGGGMKNPDVWEAKRPGEAKGEGFVPMDKRLYQALPSGEPEVQRHTTGMSYTYEGKMSENKSAKHEVRGITSALENAGYKKVRGSAYDRGSYSTALPRAHSNREDLGVEYTHPDTGVTVEVSARRTSTMGVKGGENSLSVEFFVPTGKLSKAKYISRKRGKGGKWEYEYERPKAKGGGSKLAVPDIRSVIDKIKSVSSFQVQEQDEGSVYLTSDRHAEYSGGRKVPGRTDYAQAQEAVKKLKEFYGDQVKTDIYHADEHVTLEVDIVSPKLSKSKYISRKRGKGGKWEYEYEKPKGRAPGGGAGESDLWEKKKRFGYAGGPDEAQLTELGAATAARVATGLKEKSVAALENISAQGGTVYAETIRGNRADLTSFQTEHGFGAMDLQNRGLIESVYADPQAGKGRGYKLTAAGREAVQAIEKERAKLLDRAKGAMSNPRGELSKAEARGGSYHKRVPKDGGGYRYYYNEDKYKRSPGAHVGGEEASTAYLSGKVLKAVQAAGEGGCDVSQFEALVKKFGAKRVGDMLRSGCGGQVVHKGGKFYYKKPKAELEKSGIVQTLDGQEYSLFKAEDKSGSTAIGRKGLSSPMAYLKSKGLIRGRSLDYGSGKGGDAKRVGSDAYDPNHAPDEPEGKYDTITSIYVLNVLRPGKAAEVVRKVKALLKPGGKAYFAVRRDLEKEGETSTGTYQRTVKMALPKLHEESGNFAIYVASK